MEILAVVPARGGSKSVPRKNIRPLAGRPLIAYTIEAALATRHPLRVVVSTDDDEIAGVSRDLGAEVPFLRPAELAADATTDLPVFRHCLEWLGEHEGYRPDAVVHLRPTAPLRRPEHIDRGIDLLLQPPPVDSVRSVCLAPQHPLKMWRVSEGELRPFVPTEVFGVEEAYNQPRQVLPEAYVQNGSVDVVRTEVILERGSMTGATIRALVMDEEDSVNIDSPLDWELAETLMSRRHASDDEHVRTRA